jgi:hypothetical protein
MNDVKFSTERPTHVFYRRLTAVLAVVLLCAFAAEAADAHTLSLRKARKAAKSALYWDQYADIDATRFRVPLSDCTRWTRHKVICTGTWERHVQRREYDPCKTIGSYTGNCYGGYDYWTDVRYCSATINVRFRSRHSRRLKTWVHSKECF